MAKLTKRAKANFPLVITIVLLILVVCGTAYDLRQQKQLQTLSHIQPTATPTPSAVH